MSELGLSPVAIGARNRGLVLSCLRDHSPMSRSQIAERLGLTRASISRITADLIDRGLVEEMGDAPTGVGRPMTMLGLDGTSSSIMGVDLRADSGQVIQVDLAGRERSRHPIALPHDTDPHHWATAVAESVNQHTSSEPKVRALGLAIPGQLSADRLTIRRSAHLGWEKVPFVDLVREHLNEQIPITMRHGAQCAALANARTSLVAPGDRLLYVHLSVGLGIGLAGDGALIQGDTPSWGAVGHSPLGDPTRLCACGRMGCADTVLGFGAFLADAGMADPTVRASGQLAAARLVEQRAATDPVAAAAIDALAERLVNLLGVLTAIEAPSVVVVGGYVGGLSDAFHDAVAAGLEARHGDQVRMVRSELRDSGPLVGATQLALDLALTG